jgi:Leucine-rich repeat (LRR) protein
MCKLCIGSPIDSNTIFLDCSNCTHVQTLPDNLPNLKFLIIYNTNIQVIPPYPSLEGLYMMSCPIVALPELPKLVKLNATGSKLESIPDTLYRIQSINIDRTAIVSLPTTLISATTISANGCARLDTISSKLINLESLSIMNTGFRSIPKLISLQYINIGSTSIDQLPLDYLPALRKVFAKGCQLIDPFAIIERGIDLTN